MRVLILLGALAALMVFAAPATADDARPSAAACDSHKIGARELADCLRGAADKAERELSAEIDAAIKSIEGRAGVLSAQKARWKRSLNESESQWITWRDGECQDVAPFELLGVKAGDPRLACVIDQDALRIADLKARYP